MKTQHVLISILGLVVSPDLASSSVFGQNAPEYEVYVIEYAVIGNRHLSAYVPGVDSSLTADGSYMIWLIKGEEGRNILVDAGFRPDANRSSSGYIRPDQAVAKLGISAEDVTDIIVTHLHWDHADGVPLFPNAHVWIQKDELEYYATSAWQKDGDSRGVEPRNVTELVKLNTEGRVTLVDGLDQEIIEGITVYVGGRHTYASQYVGVNTSGGTVILASDNVWFYANLDLNLANSLTFDAEAQLAAQDRMRELASRPDLIIPGHDRAVFGSFPKPAEGVARIQ